MKIGSCTEFKLLRCVHKEHSRKNDALPRDHILYVKRSTMKEENTHFLLLLHGNYLFRKYSDVVTPGATGDEYHATQDLNIDCRTCLTCDTALSTSLTAIGE